MVTDATVQILPPSGSAITATLVNMTPSGTSDGVGDDTGITANYEIDPPSGDWTLAPDGIYVVQLTGSPVEDIAGDIAQQGQIGTFVNIASMSVAPQEEGNFSAQVVVPTEMSFDQPSLVYVVYTNTGTVPYAAPLVVLTATQNGQPGAFLSLDPSLAGTAYYSNSVPSGFSESVQFLAGGATTGLLQPGESISLPVYYGGWLSSQFDPTQPITFSLSVLDNTSTQAIDWSTLAPALQPSFINDAAWNAIVPNLETQLGTTWGQFVQQLDNDALYLATVNEPTTDASQLLAFEISKADGEFAVPASTSIAVADLPAPGMDLTFALSFQPTIAGRNTPSIVGLGWTTNWDLAASTEPNGDVTINLDGPDLYFSLLPNGTYEIEDTDQGITLTQLDGAYRLVDTDGTIYQFNVNGTLDYVQDTNGNTITAGYNAQDQLVSLTDSNGEFIDFSYNSQGFVSAATDSTGQVEQFGYDATGHLASYSDEFGTINYTYVTSGTAAQLNALAEIANANGTDVYYVYNSEGWLIDQHANGGAEDTQIAYLDNPGYTSTDALGNTSEVFLNGFGAAVETIDPVGNTTEYYYDANQNLVKVVGPGELPPFTPTMSTATSPAKPTRSA